jgi:hypothetical protein
MNGREIATELARATNGVVRTLATDAQYPSFGVEIAPAGCVILVRDHGYVTGVSVGMRAWSVSSIEPMPADIATEALRRVATHGFETTMADASLALAPALEGAFEERWELSIPGGQPAPTEMWLHPVERRERASVGIFPASVRVPPTMIAMPVERRLAPLCRDVIDAVRAQHGAYDRNVVISQECGRVARAIAARFHLTWRVDGPPSPSYFSPIALKLGDEAQRELARVEEIDGVLVVRAGLAKGGWQGPAARALGELDAIGRAIDAMKGVVTMDELREGTRYRVLDSFGGLVKGETVRYMGPIDNHAPHEFIRPGGEQVLIDEHVLRANAPAILGPA